MDIRVLTVGSVGEAIRARKLLLAYGISVRLIKRTGGPLRGGCAYGVTVAATDMPQAMRLLQEGGIPFEWETP